MDTIKYRLNLEMHSSVSQSVIRVKRGETGRELFFSLMDGGKAYHIDGDSCRVALSAPILREDELVFDDCHIENDVASILIPAVLTAHPGVVPCELRVYQAGNMLVVSPKFSIIVEDTVIDDEDIIMVAESEISELTTLISTTIETINEARAAIVAMNALRDEIQRKLDNGELNGKDGHDYDHSEEYAELTEEIHAYQVQVASDRQAITDAVTEAERIEESARGSAAAASVHSASALASAGQAENSANDAETFKLAAEDAKNAAEIAATSAEQSASEVPSLKRNDKRQDADIANLKALLDGYLYRPETVSGISREFRIAENVCPFGGIDYADPVPVMLNQQISNGDFSNGATGWSGARTSRTVTDGVMTVTATGTAAAASSNIYAICSEQAIPGHKYFLSAEVKTPSDPVKMYCRGTADQFAETTMLGEWNHISAISTGASATNRNIIFLRFTKPTTYPGDTYQIRNAFAVDLTQMFGAGNEPAADSCRDIFTGAYIQYDADGTSVVANPVVADSRDANGNVVAVQDIPADFVRVESNGSVEFLTDSDTKSVRFPVSASITYLIDLKEAINDT